MDCQTVDRKHTYKLHYNSLTAIPIFNQIGWLNAVAEEGNWEVAVVKKENDVVATLPYFYKKKYVTDIITTPKHTPWLSPCIKYPESIRTLAHKIEFENSIIKELEEQLPALSFVQFSLYPNYDNILPFLWNDYEVNYQYTYIIKDIADPEKVLFNFSSNRKRYAKKGCKNLGFHQGMEVKTFYEFHKQSLKKRKQEIAFSFEHLERIYNYCKETNQGEIFFTSDAQNNIHSAIFIVWDSQAAYHLVPVINPDFYKSQSMSYLVYKVIVYLSKFVKTYDFEGGMYKHIEQGYRDYGPEKVPYFNFKKCNSKLLATFLSLKNIWIK